MMRFNVTATKANGNRLCGDFEVVSGNLGRENRDVRQREIAFVCSKHGAGIFEAYSGEEYHKLQVKPDGTIFDIGRQRVVEIAQAAETT